MGAQIPLKSDQKTVIESIQNVAKGIQAQFGAIILADPVFGKVHTTPGNWSYLRIRFPIWPGQNSIIETTFISQMVAAIKQFDPDYASWQIVVTYRALDSVPSLTPKHMGASFTNESPRVTGNTLENMNPKAESHNKDVPKENCSAT